MRCSTTAATAPDRFGWRRPQWRSLQQAGELRPLLLAFAGLQAQQQTAAPAEGSSSPSSSDASGWPTTVEELSDVIAANTPVFFLHPRERYFPCTVEWFLQHARLCIMKNFMLTRKVERVVIPYGQMEAAKLKAAYERDPKARYQLQLRQKARTGQPEQMSQVPAYAHVRETVDPSGKRDALEIVYMKFFAYNGNYKPFGIIPTRKLGAHDSDWEHVTVRLTPDGQHVTGVYYSCHRHIDGVWRSADEVPRSLEGRPESYVAINGHGSYPEPGRIIRLFGIFNDNTSADGPVWKPESCVLVTPGGKLPTVESRGEDLNGTVYPSVSHLRRSGSGSDSSSSSSSSSSDAVAASVSLVHQPNPDWLQYGGKWGSTVVAPALQEWFVGAENPLSRTWLQTVFFPLVPGVDTLLEPVEEQAADAGEYINAVAEDVQRSAEEARGSAQEQLEAYQQRLMDRFDELLRTSSSSSSRSEGDEPAAGKGRSDSNGSDKQQGRNSD